MTSCTTERVCVLRLAIAIATLTFGLASRPTLGQTRAPDTPALEEIHMVDQQNGWAVTRDQNRTPGVEPAMGVARTTDGGSRWSDVTPTFGGRFYRFYAFPRVFVFTANFAWVEGLRTVDGGQTWRPPVTPWTGALVWIDFTNANEGWALTADPAGGTMAHPEMVVFWSIDAGETWNRAAEHSRLVEGVSSLTFVSKTNGWATSWVPTAGSDWSPLYMTRNAGSTWMRQTVPRPPEVTSAWDSRTMPLKFFTARDGILPVLYANVDSKYAPIASFAIPYVTQDAGTTWRYTTPVPVANQAWRSDYYGHPLWGIYFADINHGWIVDGDTLYATINSGRQWTTIRSTSFHRMKQLEFISPQVGWAVAREAPFLLKTLDGGRAWSPVTYTISGK